ncbi:unnamed protein product [Closterium sp. NIES-53]
MPSLPPLFLSSPHLEHQGTGGVAVAGILNVLRAQHLPPKALADTRVVVAGTGSSAEDNSTHHSSSLHLTLYPQTSSPLLSSPLLSSPLLSSPLLSTHHREAEGVLTAVRRAMVAQIGQGKAAMDRAAENFWLVDDQGLMTDARVSCSPELEDFLRRSDEDERLKEGTSLAHVVKRVKPHVLVGLTGSGHLFDDDVLKAMKNSDVSRPAVFALSQPVKQGENAQKHPAGTWGGTDRSGHLFDDNVLKAMKYADVSRPAVFALSQPVKQAMKNADVSRPAVSALSQPVKQAQDAFKLLGPNALFASGCTFPDVRFRESCARMQPLWYAHSPPPEGMPLLSSACPHHLLWYGPSILSLHTSQANNVFLSLG